MRDQDRIPDQVGTRTHAPPAGTQPLHLSSLSPRRRNPHKARYPCRPRDRKIAARRRNQDRSLHWGGAREVRGG